MTIQEVQEFYKSFKCEVLTSSESNKSEIQDFSSEIRNNLLEGYLKEQAWEHDTEGVTRVYLIRDLQGRIVMFFSLKCGVAFTTYALDDDYRKLSAGEQAFVKMIVEAKRKHDNDLYYHYIEYGKTVFPEKHSLLLRIAEHRYSTEKESHEVGDFNNVMKVDTCCSAIELQHFCRCDDYELPDSIKFPLGFGLFWEKIVPIINDITEKIGCEYLYLFAADITGNSEEKKLISYYKEALLFYDLADEGVIVLKPGYDDNCVGLLQKTKYLADSRNDAWECFADHANS